MENLMIEKKLYAASVRGDVESLNKLLKEDKFLLNNYVTSTNETLLHVAAMRGHVDFAKVLLQHMPDLVNELDSKLRSPLHLASANGRVEMVKVLLDADSDVCLMEDESGRTPLDLAAMTKGQIEVINELVRARPEAIMYPLNRIKTIAILHFYVIRNGPKALEKLLEVDHTFLNSQDEEGNTILHKVIALKKIETLKYLISRNELVVNLKNQQSFTALDLIDQMQRDSETAKLMRELLVKYEALNNETLPPNRTTDQLPQGEIHHVNTTVTEDTQQPPSQDKKGTTDNNNVNWLNQKRDAIMVVAILIAGMAYQAGLNPPGGVWETNNGNYTNVQGQIITVVAGTSIMATNYPIIHTCFWAFNTASFIAALSIVLLLIRGSSRLSQTASRFCVFLQKVYFWFLTGVIWVTTTTMALTYTVAMIAITPDNKGFEFQWNTTTYIVGGAIVAWLILACVVFLINSCRCVICLSIKLDKCIKRCLPRNSNRYASHPHNDTTTTACCLCV